MAPDYYSDYENNAFSPSMGLFTTTGASLSLRLVVDLNLEK
jgi:hypothetical protein